MNSAQIALIRIIARQAVQDHLAGKTAPASEKPPIRTNRPVASNERSK